MRYVLRDGQLVPKHLAPRAIVARSNLSAPMIIRDSLDDIWNPANGQHYDSKRAYEKAVRAAGCEIVGNEAPTQASAPNYDLTNHENDVAQAMEQLGL